MAANAESLCSIPKDTTGRLAWIVKCAETEPLIDDGAGGAVDHERLVDEPGPGAHVNEVRDPALIWSWRGKVAQEQVGRTISAPILDRGAHAAAPHAAPEAEITHEPVHAPLGHLRPARRKCAGHFRRPYIPFGVPKVARSSSMSSASARSRLLGWAQFRAR